MRRKSILFAVGSLLALPIFAGNALGESNHDVVKGHGIIGPTSQNHIAFNGHSGPNGEDPKGQFHVHDNTTKDGTPRRRAQGEMTCIRVAGNRATFVVDFRKLKNRTGDGSIVTVEDNGREGTDRIGIMGFNGPPPPCPDPLLATLGGPAPNIEIVVEDAT